MKTEHYRKILNDDPDLSEKSKKLYQTMINKILKETKEEDLHKVIKNPKDYIPQLNRDAIPLSTRESMMGVILSIMSRTPLKQEMEEQHKIWYEVFKDINASRREIAGSNKPTEKQEKGLLNWKDVLKKRDKLEVGSEEHLLLSLYTFIPPRRQMDYYKLRVYFDENCIPNKDHNHFHVFSKKYNSPYLCLVEYKTAKYYDIHFDTEIPPELIQTVISSFQKNPRLYMFLDKSGKPFKDPNRFQIYSNGILKKIFDNPNVSVNSLRHSFSSFLRTLKWLSVNEHKKLAQKMGHSMQKSLEYAFIDS